MADHTTQYNTFSQATIAVVPQRGTQGVEGSDAWVPKEDTALLGSDSLGTTGTEPAKASSDGEQLDCDVVTKDGTRFPAVGGARTIGGAWHS